MSQEQPDQKVYVYVPFSCNRIRKTMHTGTDEDAISAASLLACDHLHAPVVVIVAEVVHEVL